MEFSFNLTDYMKTFEFALQKNRQKLTLQHFSVVFNDDFLRIFQADF